MSRRCVVVVVAVAVDGIRRVSAESQSEFHPKTWLAHASNSWSSGTLTYPPLPIPFPLHPITRQPTNDSTALALNLFSNLLRESQKFSTHHCKSFGFSSSFRRSPLCTLSPLFASLAIHPSIYPFIHGVSWQQQQLQASLNRLTWHAHQLEFLLAFALLLWRFSFLISFLLFVLSLPCKHKHKHKHTHIQWHPAGMSIKVPMLKVEHNLYNEINASFRRIFPLPLPNFWRLFPFCQLRNASQVWLKSHQN